jgi:ABC-type multidrug transport system fused ATPase/permease subunit
MFFNIYSKFSSFKFLNINDFISLFIILLLFIFSIIIEGLTITSIPLFFSNIFQDIKVNNPFLTIISDFLNKNNFTDLVDIFLVILFFFFLKSLFLYSLNILEFVFLKRLRIKISNILLNKFLNNQLADNYKESSSTKIWKIELVNNFTFTISNYISFLRNIFYLILVLFLIIFFSMRDFIYFFSILFVSLLFFYKIFKNKLYLIGKNIIIFTDKKVNVVQNIFDGIKTIIIFQKQEYFKKIFNKYNVSLETNAQLNAIISSFPNHFFDFFTVLIIFLIYLFILQYSSYENLIYTLGLISYGLVRIVSILKTLNQNYLAIKRNSYSVKVLLDDLKIVFTSKKNKIANFSNINNINIIEIYNLNFNYTSKKNLFEGLSFNFKRNNFYGLYGASGSGKTTFLDIISGIYSFNSGLVNIFCNKDKISYVSQESFISQDTIKKNIAFGLDESDINSKKIKESIKKSQLSSFINNLPKKSNFELYKNGTNISVGQKQRLGIARSLYLYPDLLIMDEPTSALDQETEINFINLLKKLRKNLTIIMTTHKLKLKNMFDVSLLIKNGKIVKF